MSEAIVLPIIVAMALWPPWPFGRDRDREEIEGTIGELSEVEIDVEGSEPITGSEQKAIESYRSFLELASGDPVLEAEAMRRLADLQLETAEAEQLQRNLEGLDLRSGSTVSIYEQLLEAYPSYAKNDLVLYQLARAHEAGGELEAALAALDRLVTEYPETRHYEEAHFRRGETLFVLERYREAEQAYQAVLDRGPSAAFYEQSLYKQGWAQFKQLRFEDSLQPFFALLDIEFRHGAAAETGEAADPAQIYLDSGRAEQELIDDTLRVVSIGFSYLDGPDSITRQFRSIGPRTYAYVVYSNLGDFYLSQERYQDAADAYEAFVALDPYHAKAPLMQAEVINAYEQGGFADLVLDGKREFVEIYGPASPYWQSFSYEQQPEAVALLKDNLTDLAGYHHARGQESGALEDYAEAARWYRAYLQSFPDDVDAPETNFLLAEVLFESRRFDEAAREYERTAYAYPLHGRASEAGYAALIAYAEHESTLAGAERAQWHRQGIDSALRFAVTYPEHREAARVQTDAAEKLFALSEFALARDVGNAVLTRDPPADPGLQRTAWTVVAHSEFDLENFAAAETAYLALEGLLPPGDESRGEIAERIASSVYKQGEQARAAGDLGGAVAHFMRVGVAAPTSTIRSTAEYDAAAALIELEEWTRAASVLEDFRARYPGHSLGDDVTAKLAVAYLESGDGLKAAAELERVADSGAEPAVRREALWRAGELYAEAGRTFDASNAFARFVERHPVPVGEAIEARQKLAELSGELGNEPARLDWLADIVAADAAAGAERTERTRYLAASAQLELAAPARDAFTTIRLVVPLQESLALKRQRMEEALAAYGKAADYGVQEVTTAATYEIAELYHSLSRALFDSERPPELSSAELMQYDILLEEQAFPFEEEAIELHEVNARRTASGIYDQWVRKSLAALAELLPVRYAKEEASEPYVANLH
jgi:TolA-binding protein